ncbi:putative iron-regulated membrane protein [Chryseobacterium bernardetii]|uniref:Iron-regulated membrane protein n=2 Tax=Chryseobacterium TaxID=59732 RepID=A0ACC6ISU5_9FLAO|nr:MULTISPECIES: PepSY-associated TM helix domain-containing protein [Chryseobacterium]MDR6370021.1 putative iron-regulated membrane protein [Chryseobacterium vietnamense]MDR6440736.1 putative iron-regulated membrane protein [Chryseobacterium bernardetii]TQM21583.1 putative iron-regulated membrane protein [Chryseobacterium aquifrigidense]
MKLKFRKIAYQLHLWLGLTSGLIVVIMATTGCILSFEEELKHLVHPNRYYVENIGRKKLSLSELTEKAEKALPEGLKVKRVIMSSDPAQTYVFRTLKMNNEAWTYWGTYLYYYRVYIDPYTGKVQEVEDAKKDFFEIVLDLHRRLLLGEKIGKTITGYSTLVLAIILFSGLVIWYPRKMSKSMLKGMFFIKLSANWKRINYDLHNVLGFYSVIPLLLISYSALIWSFEDADKWIKNTLNGNIPTEKKAKSTIPSGEFSNREHILNLIGTTMENGLKNKKSALINFPRSEEGTFYAEITYDGRQYRNEQFNFDQYSGGIVKSKSYKNKNIGYGTALRERNYDLHTGSILGLTGRVIYFLAAMIATSLPITGFIIYLNRKKKKPKHKKNKIVYPSHH